MKPNLTQLASDDRNIARDGDPLVLPAVPFETSNVRVLAEIASRRKLSGTSTSPGQVAAALNSVRRTAHQQFGRVEKILRGGCYSSFVRQHEDDFVIRLHDVVVIVLRFRDHDGARQIEARRGDPLCGGLHGTFGREISLGIPVQQLFAKRFIAPCVDDYLCERISGLEGKRWQNQSALILPSRGRSPSYEWPLSSPPLLGRPGILPSCTVSNSRYFSCKFSRWQARLGIARVEQQSQFQLQSPRQIWFSDIFSNSNSAAADVCEAASRRRGTDCTVTGTICPPKRCLSDLAISKPSWHQLQKFHPARR